GIRDRNVTGVQTCALPIYLQRSVLVVGGGNSGAQLAADLLPTASAVTWVTRRPPRFLPDEIDGRALFQLATRHVQGTDDTENPGGIAALGDIVVTPPIRHARDAGLLT